MKWYQSLNLKQKVLMNVIVVFCFAVFVYILYQLFLGPNTFANPENTVVPWDGVTVSTSFSGGNGSMDNPYQIKTAPDFIYFQQVLKENKEYQEKSYVLGNDIDLGGFSISMIHFFQGGFNGQGHTVSNFKITSDQKESGLFLKLQNATISNINFKNYSLENSMEEAILGGLASNIKSSNIQNVSFHQITLSPEKNSTMGILAGNLEDSKVSQVISVSNLPFVGNDSNNNEISNIILSEKSLFENLDGTNFYYQCNEESCLQFLNDQAISKSSVFESWHVEQEDIEWNLDEMFLLPKQEAIMYQNSGYVPKGDITPHASGVVDDTVYVNELEADWNELLGFNYTDSNNGTLPTGNNQNHYHEGNTVPVQITYQGSRTLQNGQTLTANVSLEEQQSKFVYYKTYVVNDNGTSDLSDDYIKIDLIDNPFADMPTNYAFQNWVTKDSRIKIYYDYDYYERYAIVPVTYTENQPNDVVVDFEIAFTESTVSKLSTFGSWGSAISNSLPSGMKKIEFVKITYDPFDMTGYFYQRSASFWESYSGYDERGNPINTTCRSFGRCTYYERIEGEMFDSSKTYYELKNGRMQLVDNDSLPIVSHEEENKLYQGMNMAGFYRKKQVSRGGSLNGTYNDRGELQSGTCSTSSGCSIYEVIPYYKENGQEEMIDKQQEYYYLVTRDTNIIVLDRSMSGSWDSQDRPFTVTSIYDGVDYRSQANWDISDTDVVCEADTRIEFVKVSSGKRTSNTDPNYSGSGWFGRTQQSLFASWNNVKVGRGLVRNGNYRNFVAVVGGASKSGSTGSSNSVTKYKLIIESGFYNSTALVNATSGSTVYVEMKAVYGNDYDKVMQNNDNLDVYYCAGGSWGGNVNASTTTSRAIDLIVKSGRFGSGKFDYTTGIYVGGRTGGTHYAMRAITVEGGYIYNLIGGPLSASNRSTVNDIFMSIKGGEIDMITGGAGRSDTYGNRLIQVTGGKINYSVFGGSNGYEGSSYDGALHGSTFVYVGGNSQIGDETLVQNGRTLFGSEAGSVFGIGNGRSGYTAIGSCDNSFIIVDGATHILGSVYGGGNYGATGSSSGLSSTKTDIHILGGTVDGSIYGGGNKNGSGSTSTQSTVSILMKNGVINGSIYGGSNETGTIYGDVSVSALGGTVVTDIYGGGKGGKSGNNNGTFVTGNVSVNIGEKDSTLEVRGDVFGGSAYGTVNSSTNTTSVSDKKTSVSVSNGIVKGGVYGGARGNNTYTPYVAGNVTVLVTGGNLGNVFGGNDAAGKPNGSVSVTISGGTIGNVFGGGNNASVNSPSITMTDGTVTSLFGGSNYSGNVTDSHIQVRGGSIQNLYGGNNAGGTTTKSYIVIDDGTIESLYGGGKLTATDSSNVTLNGGKITNAFGGGESASVTETTITQQGSTVTSLYGGSNMSGDVNTSNVLIYSGKVGSVYGGNNIGGITNSPKITMTDGEVSTLYGGGNQAEVLETYVEIRGGILGTVYGGGNKASTRGNTSLLVQSAHVLDTIYGGGNAGNVQGNTHLVVLDTIIDKSVYGGGNKADVIGNATTDVGGSTKIGESLFGGGNSGAIGVENVDTSFAIVNVTGAVVGKNVYGGCNTSVVYGTTDVNIGSTALTITSLKRGDINISGTVFGGGEANAEGSDIYDYTFICVTVAIDIDINGAGYLEAGNTFTLSGSIFGSGNASSSKGTSNIYIANLGTKENPSRNISIQRSDEVIIDHSYMEFSGTTDRTNEFSKIKYSFNRIDLLKIKNGTTLLLKENANLLKHLQSVVDINGKEELAQVEINDETKTVTKNVDNRIYLVANKNLNIATNESATSYGEIEGMTFLGMYSSYQNGSISYGLYDPSLSYGSSADAGDVIVGGSYVLGLHAVNHDITKNGFYSNFINESYTELSTAYIDPTPEDTNYYMWMLGLNAINYNFMLTASKYSSLGTYELSMRDFSSGNTKFEIIGFNSEGLSSGVSLVDSNNVPKIAATPEEANSVLGLSMKSETSEWTGYGTTKLLSNQGGSYTGTKLYQTDNISQAPSFMFYLYHAKNISLDEDLGTVVVTLQAMTPINEIEYDVQLVTITIDINASSYEDGDFYDASITYGEKYEMPSATVVNITNKSQFTAYYSLIANSASLEKFYGNNNDYYRVLSSNFALPVGTEITMLDYGVGDNTPGYYYYKVTEENYQEKLQELANNQEATYPLSKFVRMASTTNSNVYDDASMNQTYYHDDLKLVMEEFVFLFDFNDSFFDGESKDNSILLELRNGEGRAVVPVLGIRQGLMKYSLYQTSNVVLKQDVEFSEYAYYETNNPLTFSTRVTYDQTENRDSIIDTNYESSRMGWNVTLIDQSGNKVSSSLLSGTYIKINQMTYFADSDGVFRIKLADKVSNLSPSVYFYPGHLLPAGVYTLKLSLFASDDGLHPNGSLSAEEKSMVFTLVSDDNMIVANTKPENKIIDGLLGVTSDGNETLSFQVHAKSQLLKPNLRIRVYRRSSTSYDALEYEEISFSDLFTNTLSKPNDFGYVASSEYELLLSTSFGLDNTFTFRLQDLLKSGTYRIEFLLYNENHLIDSDFEQIIIKKDV